MDVIRWGIIGCGDVCEVKAGPAFQKVAHSELVAVMRRTGALAEDFAKRHGVAKWYDTVDALLADPAVNAVYVATPPGSHEAIALQVCAARKPCYLEKPAARNLAETKRIVNAFTAAGVPLFVAYYRRGQAKFRRARELVRSGALGAVTSVHYALVRAPQALPPAPAPLPWRLRARHAGGGLVMDVGCHTIDIVDFIAGELRGARGVAARARADGDGRYAVEDSVSLSARVGANAGAVCTMSWSFAGPRGTPERELITVRGTKGELRLSCFGGEPLELDTYGDGGERTQRVEPAETLRNTHYFSANALHCTQLRPRIAHSC